MRDAEETEREALARVLVWVAVALCGAAALAVVGTVLQAFEPGLAGGDRVRFLAAQLSGPFVPLLLLSAVLITIVTVVRRPLTAAVVDDPGRELGPRTPTTGLRTTVTSPAALLLTVMFLGAVHLAAAGYVLWQVVTGDVSPVLTGGGVPARVGVVSRTLAGAALAGPAIALSWIWLPAASNGGRGAPGRS